MAYEDNRGNNNWSFEAGFKERVWDETVAFQSDPDKNRRGEVLLSAETIPDYLGTPLDWLVVYDFGAFLKFIRPLPSVQRELILAYYVLAVPQITLAHVLNLRQGQISKLILSGLRSLGGSEKMDLGHGNVKDRDPLIVRHDPDCLGEFRVKIEDWEKVFMPRSTVVRTGDMDYSSIDDFNR